MSYSVNRRIFLGSAFASLAATQVGWSGRALAQEGKSLTIAYNTVLPAWDPTRGVAAVNPGTQSIYRAVFTPYVEQNPDLSLRPGILTKWEWNESRTKIHLQVRDDAYWHDGSPVTAEDVVWSLERAANPDTGNPTRYMWEKVGKFQIDGNNITADVKSFDPAFLKWLSFFTAYVLPKKAYEKMGPEGFEANPIGSGPYMIEEFQRNSFVRLKAFDKYFGPKPHFDTVVIKFVPDPTSRVAEVESGSSDLALEVSYDEFDRLKEKPGLEGVATPISDIGMIFITNVEPMLDKNVRLALHHAINKEAIVKRLLRGYGVPLDTLSAPEYEDYDPTIKVGYDLEKAKQLMAASGYSPAKPVRFKIQTTRGFKPKDYEMIEAIVGMWRKIGAEAEIEVYEIAKHFELRTQHKLAPAAFYNWGNSIGDPETSVARAMYGPSLQSAWKTKDLDVLIEPLWSEKDEAKRMEGYKKVNRYIAEQGYVIPLLQYVQPIVYRKGLKFKPYSSGILYSQDITEG